ncbi:MAG: flagellin [Lachnospiraceae bacterium]|nr:flagellin [Lachnospiraceae bacterium]MDD7027530.1 flagellin [Lachnospiraceae bacterium]MDY5701714.1 flagellin [Lachnospiraceae bacterium]
MSISGIQSRNTYEALSSGYRINRAADDAAGLSISEKLKSNSTGLSVGSSNAKDGNSLINVAEGALSGIQDALQRIRELGVRSMNGLYGASEKQAFQQEIEGLKGTIQSTAKNTSFNTMKLLDGSMADIELATNPKGGGLKIQLVNSTLESLGIADFDVTKNFNLDAIDNAIQRISSARSSFGAQSNRLDYTVNYNDYANYNLTAANSRIRDTEYGSAVIDKNRKQALQEYKLFAMKAQMNSNAGFLKLF